MTIVRHYNSLANKPNQIGYGWSIFGNLTVLSNSAVSATRPDQRVFQFSLLNGQWRPDADVNERLTRLTDGSGNTTGWELTLADGVVERYTSSGLLAGYRHASGLTISVAYNASSQTVLTDSFGLTLVLNYNAQNNLETLTDPEGGVTHYAYDGAGNLVTVTRPDGGMRTYHYEDSRFPHALTGITDENGQRFATYAYDDQGRAILSEHADGAERVGLSFNSNGTTTVTDAGGAARSYGLASILGVLRSTGVSQPGGSGCGASASHIAYDANGNVASRTDFNGHTTTYAYDLARNLETSRTEAYGSAEARTITTVWHPTFRLPVKVTEPGLETTYVHDARANVTQETRRDTQTNATRTWTWAYTYSASVPGALLQKTEDGPRLDVADQTTWTYYPPDAACAGGHAGCRGQLAQVTDALGHTTQVSRYNANGQPEAIVDPNGLVTTLDYDARQRLTAINAGGEITAYSYDPAGLLTRATAPDGAYLAYTYDAAHRLSEVQDEAGNRLVYTLDAMGNRIKEDAYDPQGQLARTRSRVYDALNRLEQDIGDAAGRVTVYEYDAQGNPRRTLAPLGRTSQRTHDALDRPTLVVDPMGGQTAYAYDGRDQLTQVTDPKSLSTAYTRNGFGEVTRIDSPDTGATTLAYDPAGNPASRTDARGRQAAYGWDALNRPTQLAYGDGTRAYAWDNCPNGAGRLCTLHDPAGETHYEYDPHGRPTRKSQTVAGLTLAVAYAYDAAGRPAGLTLPSGRIVDYRYAGGRITGIDIDSQPLITDARHAPFGPIEGWTWGNGQASRIVHDRDGRPTRIEGLVTLLATDFAWDVADRVTAVQDGLRLPDSFGYDPLDRLVAAQGDWGDQAFAYDAVGNRTLKTQAGQSTQYQYGSTHHHLTSEIGPVSRNYQYDPAGNLIGDGTYAYAYDDAGRLVQVNQGGVASYRYNALGQRVYKATAAGTRRFVYDEAGRLLGEYDETGQARREYVYLDDRPVAVLADGALYYVQADHLGTPRKLTRPADNQVVWSWNGAPFGETPPNEDPDGDGVPFEFNPRFPGQYFDAETGRHYNYFRDYDPERGRYAESDPIGLAGGLNLYAYVGGNPVSRIDPSGLIGLEFVRETGSLYVYDDFGEYMFACRAGNNTTRASRGPWPMGFFPYSHYNRHSESGPTGRFGSHGIYVFDVPGREGVGVHSGRRGPKSATQGCVRTTDPCMDLLNRLHRQTPITDIMVH